MKDIKRYKMPTWMRQTSKKHRRAEAQLCRRRVRRLSRLQLKKRNSSDFLDPILSIGFTW